MAKEFDLSDFIEEDMYIGLPEDREEADKSEELLSVPVKKIKEFIKIILEINKTAHSRHQKEVLIKKASGDKLITE